MRIRSDTFSDGEVLPTRHTKEGNGLSPTLRWADLPQGTRELALVVEQVETGSGERRFSHWLAYAIPPEWDALEEGFGNRREPGGVAPARHGTNGFERLGYDGPYGRIGRD